MRGTWDGLFRLPIRGVLDVFSTFFWVWFSPLVILHWRWGCFLFLFPFFSFPLLLVVNFVSCVGSGEGRFFLLWRGGIRWRRGRFPNKITVFYFIFNFLPQFLFFFDTVIYVYGRLICFCAVFIETGDPLEFQMRLNWIFRGKFYCLLPVALCFNMGSTQHRDQDLDGGGDEGDDDEYGERFSQ